MTRAYDEGCLEALVKFAGDPPWKREAPDDGKKKKTLSDDRKAAARRRAAEAGRPYPNLVDNMWASRSAKTGAEDACRSLGLPLELVEKLAAGAWQRAEGKNPEGGLNAKGRASLKAEGHNIKPPVSSAQAEKSPKAAARRKSFCARMGGMPGPMKKDNGEPTRKALSLRKWDC